ncbi:hypothetical protein ES702_06133 [subsurface metagenome]
MRKALCFKQTRANFRRRFSYMAESEAAGFEPHRHRYCCARETAQQFGTYELQG